MRNVCRAEEFGGASVTMPLKVTVASMLDRVTDEAQAIGAVNTIVLEQDEQDRKLLIGTNTLDNSIILSRRSIHGYITETGSALEMPSSRLRPWNLLLKK